MPVDELGLMPRCARRRCRWSNASPTISAFPPMPNGCWKAISMHAAMSKPEGPYGEFLGYYGAVKRNPVFHLTAITRRRDALFQTSTISGAHDRPHRDRAARRPAQRSADLARAGDGGARAGRRSMSPPPAAARSMCASPCASACPARPAMPSPPASARSRTARTCSSSTPTSTSSTTNRWTGRWRRASSPTATSSSSTACARCRSTPRSPAAPVSAPRPASI